MWLREITYILHIQITHSYSIFRIGHCKVHNWIDLLARSHVDCIKVTSVLGPAYNYIVNSPFLSSIVNHKRIYYPIVYEPLLS
jgi:hypothetical protein